MFVFKSIVPPQEDWGLTLDKCDFPCHISSNKIPFCIGVLPIIFYIFYIIKCSEYMLNGSGFFNLIKLNSCAIQVLFKFSSLAPVYLQPFVFCKCDDKVALSSLTLLSVCGKKKARTTASKIISPPC